MADTYKPKRKINDLRSKKDEELKEKGWHASQRKRKKVTQDS